LVSRQRAQSVHIRLGIQQAPELARHAISDGVLDLHPAAQKEDFLCGVIARQAAPAWIAAPILLQREDFFDRDKTSFDVAVTASGACFRLSAVDGKVWIVHWYCCFEVLAGLCIEVE